MNNIAIIINKGFLNSSCNILNNDFLNVREVRRTWFNLNYLFFSVLNHSRLSNEDLNKKEFSIAVSAMNKMDLLSNNAVHFFKQNQRNFTQTFSGILDNCKKELSNIDLSLLHEYLLGIELKIQPTCISIVEGKNNKDITGAYYTPSDLALAVVEKAFIKY